MQLIISNGNHFNLPILLTSQRQRTATRVTLIHGDGKLGNHHKLNVRGHAFQRFRHSTFGMPSVKEVYYYIQESKELYIQKKEQDDLDKKNFQANPIEELKLQLEPLELTHS